MITSNKRCLYCYKILENNGSDYHGICSKKFFGSATPLQIQFGLSEIKNLAVQVLGKSTSVTGVQPKISLDDLSGKYDDKRLTIVGLWGNYILKLPIDLYRSEEHTSELQSL